jgi:hypothetical protein
LLVTLSDTPGVEQGSGGRYLGDITLEVFASDRAYLLYSREVLRRLWDGA